MTRIDKGDSPTQVVSHLISARLGTIQTEKNLAMTYQSQEKYTITVSGQHAGRRLLDQFRRAQDKGPRFWQTRSHAVIVYNSVPADCIYKVISQKGKRTLFERLSTLRPAPKIALKGAWQSQQQQQQQDTSESASSRRKLVQREEQGNPTDIPELPSARKLKRSTGSLVQEEQPESKVDLRIEGHAQDVILEDEERMGHIQEVVEKLEMVFTLNLFLKIWESQKNSMMFSEESSRTVHEMGNIKLYQLGQMTRTIQCHSCWKHLPGGLTLCRVDTTRIQRLLIKRESFEVGPSGHPRSKLHRLRGRTCGLGQHRWPW